MPAEKLNDYEQKYEAWLSRGEGFRPVDADAFRKSWIEITRKTDEGEGVSFDDALDILKRFYGSGGVPADDMEALGLAP